MFIAYYYFEVSYSVREDKSFLLQLCVSFLRLIYHWNEPIVYLQLKCSMGALLWRFLQLLTNYGHWGHSQELGVGGAQVVSLLAFYSDDPSLSLEFFYKICVWKERK